MIKKTYDEADKKIVEVVDFLFHALVQVYDIVSYISPRAEGKRRRWGVNEGLGVMECFPSKNELYCINGPRGKFAQLDMMILDSMVVLDFEEPVFIEASKIHTELPRGARQLKGDLPCFMKIFPSKSKTNGYPISYCMKLPRVTFL